MNNVPEVQKEMEGTGATINAAIEAVLKKINKDRDDVTVEILEKPRNGFLGIGATPARVKVSYYEQQEIAPVIPKKPEVQANRPMTQAKPHRPVAPAEKKEAFPSGLHQKLNKPEPTPQKPVGLQMEKRDLSAFEPAKSEASQKAKEFISGLLPFYGITAEIDVKEDKDGNIAMELLGGSMGVVIGRRGDTLDAMQYLCSLVVNRKEEKHYRVILDTENYRAKREESLIRLARKIAGKVLKYKKSMTLEPMNPYERRIIHSALQDYRGITTYSTGNEPNRRIVITLSGAQRNGNQPARRAGN